MRAPASLYAILGLEPGADRAAVEQAYRRLIKRHHPDRSGGDAGRAAEINRAYFELRRQQEGAEPPPVVRRPNRRRVRRSKGRRRSRLWPLLVMVAAVLVWVSRERLIEGVPRWVSQAADASPAAMGSGRAVEADSVLLDGPLNEPVIAGAIGEAVELVRRGDVAGLAQWSRDCHRRLRARPEVAQLDRCAAFDDAVVAVADGNRLNDRGVFGASAVTARQMIAGRLLSSDYLAIERRLDRIRTSVELTLRTGA